MADALRLKRLFEAGIQVLNFALIGNLGVLYFLRQARLEFIPLFLGLNFAFFDAVIAFFLRDDDLLILGSYCL